MFPDVKAENGGARLVDDTSHERVFLVLGRRNEEFSVSAYGKPGPSTSEACRGSRIELGLHFIEGTEVGIDFILDRSHRSRVAGTRPAHESPEHGMVEMAATRVDDRGLDLGRKTGDVSLDGGKAEALECRSTWPIDNLVDVVNIGLMMLGVVNIHRRRIDVRFESVILIRKIRERERHVEDVLPELLVKEQLSCVGDVRECGGL